MRTFVQPLRLTRAAALVALLAFSGPSEAIDIILLDNGVELVGTLREAYGKDLTLDTDYAGLVKVKWSKVVGLKTDRKVRLRLEDNRIVEGVVSPAERGVILVQEEGKDEATRIQLSEVARINDPGARWHGFLTLSGKVEDGNTLSKAVYFSGEGVRETEWTRLLARLHGGWEKEMGLETERNFYGLVKLDVLFSRDVFGYVSDEVRTDRFEDLTFRNVASVGAGHYFAKESAFTFWVEGGPAHISEELRDGTHDTWFGARLATHLRWELPIGIEFRDDLTAWPNFERTTDWQLHNEATLSWKVGAHWNLSLSVLSDLDHEPVAGKEKHDNKYVLGLGYRF